MTKVKSINWTSRQSKEADILLSDNFFDLLCFCHPCSYGENEIFTDKKVYILEAENIYLEDDTNYFISKLENNYYGYHIRCKLIDKDRKLLKLGGFILKINNDIPSDIKNGSFISLNCDRLDLY